MSQTPPSLGHHCKWLSLSPLAELHRNKSRLQSWHTARHALLFLPCIVLALVGLGAEIKADTYFAAHLDASQVVFNTSHTTATGDATFVLNDARTQLRYDIQFDGLDLEPNPANRTDPNDIVGMHIHFQVPDVIGPHILNIFGNPSEDDADLIVDFANESLSGIFDISDASRDPVTGDLLPQFFPLTTKVISDWLDELDAAELYLAVHTVEASSTPPGVAIRGQIRPVPEPSGQAFILSLVLGLLPQTSHRWRLACQKQT